MSTLLDHLRVGRPIRALSCGIANIRLLGVKKKRCSL